MNNTKIERVEHFKFLGVTLDETLSWKYHTNQIATKISRTIGVFNQLKKFLLSFTLHTLYNSLILSHLNYGILEWGSKTERLFKLQKKCIRVITNSKYNAHTGPLFKREKFLKIDDLYKLNVLKFFFKYEQLNLPVYFQSSFITVRSDIHNYRTRNCAKLSLPKTKHKFAEKCIRYQLPKIINSTSKSITDKINTHSYYGFSNYVKLSFLNDYETECNIENCYVCQVLL